MASKTQSKNFVSTRIILGFVIAPVIGPLLYQIWVFGNTLRENDISLDAAGLNMLLNKASFEDSIIVVFFNYGIVVLFALPIFIQLYRRRLTNFWIISFVGGLVPLIPFFIMSTFSGGHIMPDVMNPEVWMNPVLWAILGMLVAYGATSGAIFWLIARPDREQS